MKFIDIIVTLAVTLQLPHLVYLIGTSSNNETETGLSEDKENLPHETDQLRIHFPKIKSKNKNSTKTGKPDPIHELIQHFHDKHTKATTATTTTTTSTTPAPMNNTCSCGTGAKSKLSVRLTRENDDSEEEELSDVAHDEHDDDDISQGGGPHFRNGSKANSNIQSRIVHGVASKPNGWPWVVAVVSRYNAVGTTVSDYKAFGGGTLINNQYVLTAAHIFGDLTRDQIIQSVSVLLGSNSLAANATERTVVRLADVRIHGKFNRVTFDYDIALLKLASPVTYSNTIRPVCLSQTGSPFNSRKAVVAGWGTTSNKDSLTIHRQKWLREAVMKTIPNSKCQAALGSRLSITSRMICAIGQAPVVNVSSPCFGDSGGPLMLWRPKSKSYTLIGIITGGVPPCGQGSPGVFTRVKSFINFIKNFAKGSQFCSNSFS